MSLMKSARGGSVMISLKYKMLTIEMIVIPLMAVKISILTFLLTG